MLGTGRIPTTLEYQDKLKEVFDQDYTTQEINDALVEIQELKDRVIEQNVEEADEIFAFPDQFIEGT